MKQYARKERNAQHLRETMQRAVVYLFAPRSNALESHNHIVR